MKLKTTQEKIAEIREFYHWLPEKKFRKLIKKMYLANRPTIAICYTHNPERYEAFRDADL